jgi:flavin reductase (DIM6/NTAB) family NADH-FMN oxidoreductase RutF
MFLYCLNAMNLDEKKIQELDKNYRTNLISCLSGTKPAYLVGTTSKNANTNLAIFSNIIHIGANPALIGILQRPVVNDSHSYKNILETSYFTLNQVNNDIVENAHYTSARFDANVSEFEACKLTEEYVEGFIAPFVKESKLKIGLKFIQEIPLEINNTILLIGKVVHISVPDNFVQTDGNINLEGAQSISAGGLETYYNVKKIRHFPYAKVDKLPF